jgi:hypothetical protein
MDVKIRLRGTTLRAYSGTESRPAEAGRKKRQRRSLAVLQKLAPAQSGKTPLLPRPAQKISSIFAA